MSNSIDEAIAALRRGDQQSAFETLQTYLAQYPHDADAWYWLSEATPDLRRKMEALHRFIELAPDHPRVPMVELRLNYLKGQISKLPPDPYASALRPRDVAVPPVAPPSSKTAPLRPLHVVLNEVPPTVPPPRHTPPIGRHLLQSLLDSADPTPQPPMEVVEEATGDRGIDVIEDETSFSIEVVPTTPRRRPAWWVWLLIGLIVIQMIGLLYLMIRLEWVLQQVG